MDNKDLEFRIRIEGGLQKTKTINKWQIIVTFKTPDGRENETKSILYLSDTDLKNLAEEQEEEKYGTILSKKLFSGKVRASFNRAFSKSNENNRLRILLVIQTAIDDEIRSLHWERLCAPINGDESWSLLARNQRVSFSRFIHTSSNRDFLPIKSSDLHALVLVACPSNLGDYKDLKPFDIERAISGLKKTLDDSQITYELVTKLTEPVVDHLSKKLTNADKPFTLLHIICHGRVQDNGETILYWAKENNQVETVTGSALVEELSNLGERLPRFAFLCSCESGSSKAEAQLGSLAQKLVEDLGMLAVVAMTRKVSVETALALGESFYPQLRNSGELDVALQKATAGLGYRDDITVPTLFSSLNKCLLFGNTSDQRELVNDKQKLSDIELSTWKLLKEKAQNWINVLDNTIIKNDISLEIQLTELPNAVNPQEFVVPADYQPQKILSKDFIHSFEKGEITQVMILGDADSGKTTVLWKLLKTLYDENKKSYQLFPVYLRLSSWTTKEKSFLSWVEKKILESIGINCATKFIRDKKLVLLLDGFDEVNKKYRDDCLKKLNDFIKDYSQAKIVLCSRIQEYENILGYSLQEQEEPDDNNLKLNLKKAFYIEPLKVEELEQFLKKDNDEITINTFKRLFQRYKELRNFGTLILIDKTDINIKTFSENDSSTTILKYLLNKYVERQFKKYEERQSNHKVNSENFDKKYNKKLTKKLLSYLASKLRDNGRIFQLELIQPCWLSLEKYKFIYRLATGLIIGFVLGIVAGTYFIYYLKLVKYPDISPILALKLITIGLLSGIIAGLIQGILSHFCKNTIADRMGIVEIQALRLTRFLQKWEVSIEELFSTVSRRFIRGTVPGILFAFFLFIALKFVSPELLNIYPFAPIFLSGIFSGVAFSFISDTIKIPLIGQIRPEKILISSVIFAGFGLFYIMLRFFFHIYQTVGYDYAIYELLIFMILGAFYGGLKKQDYRSQKRKKKPEKSNQGIKRLQKHAVLSFVFVLIASMIVSSFIDSVKGPFLIFIGIAVGLLAGLGANDGGGIVCIQHFLLRVILYWNGDIPWNYTEFLDYATDELVFLKRNQEEKVYFFINNKLLDYFADQYPVQNVIKKRLV